MISLSLSRSSSVFDRTSVVAEALKDSFSYWPLQGSEMSGTFQAVSGGSSYGYGGSGADHQDHYGGHSGYQPLESYLIRKCQYVISHFATNLLKHKYTDDHMIFLRGKLYSALIITVDLTMMRSAVPLLLTPCAWLPFYLQLPVPQFFLQEHSKLNYVE